MKTKILKFRDLIGENKIEYFFSLWKEFSSEIEDGYIRELQSDFTLCESRFNEAKRKESLNLESPEYIGRELNKIKYGLLGLIKKIESAYQTYDKSRPLKLETNRSFEKIKSIFGNDLDIDTNVDISSSVIKNVISVDNFSKPLSLYFAGRIGAGKSTSCNKFLNVNIEGYFDTTKQITHSGFTTGLSIFDLPGQNGEPFYENVCRVALGMPEKVNSFNIGSPNSEKFTYAQHSPEGLVKKLEFNLSEWTEYATNQNILPDFIIYTIAIGKGQQINTTDLEFICTLLKALKDKKEVEKILFLFNDLGGVDIDIFKRFKDNIELCYNLTFKDERIQYPLIFSVNALTGEGFVDFIKYLCEVLPPETIGGIKNLFNKKFKKDIQVQLNIKFKETCKKIASKLSKLHPFDIDKDSSLFEDAIIAIIEYSKLLLIDYDETKHKIFFETNEQILTDIAKEMLSQIVIPKTVDVPKIGKKPELIPVTNKFADIPQSLLIDAFNKSQDLIDLKKRTDTLLEDLLDDFMSKTHASEDYDTITGSDKIVIKEATTIKSPIIGPMVLECDDYDLKVIGRKKAFENKDPKALKTTYKTKKNKASVTVPNAVIGFREEKIEVDYNKNGITFISFILGCSTELEKLINEHEAGLLKSYDLKRRAQNSILNMVEKLDSLKADLEQYINSNAKDSENNIYIILSKVI